MTEAPTSLDPTVVEDYLARTRWFGGKGRPFEVTDVRSIGELPGGPPLVVIHLVELTYSDDEGGVELYQVPLSFYEHPETRLDHAFVGWWMDPEHGWVHAYDALHDRDAMALWQRAFDSPGASGALTFHRLPGHELDLDAHSTLFSGEQSNSSVAFGEDALMKVFRKVTPGANPDITVHAALTEADSTHIASLYGWLEAADPADPDGGVLQLAMLQEFLRTATDGFELALASVRSLFADDPDIHAATSGGDFAPEATRLGEALREVHEALRGHFPSDSRPAAATAELAATMADRLDAALPVVPGLAPYTAALRTVFGRVASLDGLDVQQVHGDLHLGQTLRTAGGWKIVDFEGEPAKPLAERQLPDSRWRDVAGMLRSFDYAPAVVVRSMTEQDSPTDGETIKGKAEQWAERNKNHFLNAYADGALSSADRTLLNAYVADKAVYETVYETRNRPTWVEVPLQAVARIGAT